MKSLKMFLLLGMLISTLIVANMAATPDPEEDEEIHYENGKLEEQAGSLRGSGRFLAEKVRVVAMTCDKYPRVCRGKNSPGPDCCKKKCVNVTTDGLNCGACGKRCKYSEICCKGACVKPMSNKKHCGGCNNKCKKGSACVYGICSYA